MERGTTQEDTERAIRTRLESIDISLAVIGEELAKWGELRDELKRLASDPIISPTGEDAGSHG